MSASPPLPSDRGRLLSDWGMRPGRRTGAERMHAGMDLGHPDGTGTPIFNIQDGVVELVLRDDDRRRAFNGYGNGVVVHHPADDTWALYAHMDQVEPDVAPGMRVPAGKRLGTMGNSSNGKFPGMGAHLHLELRRRRPTGDPPFPGPYPRSVQQPFNNLDPRPWLESKGLRFAGRGGFELLPGSPMAQGRALRAVSGVDPYPEQQIPPWGDKRRFPETALAAFSTEGEIENDYEPPARFDRDVYFGLKPIEWAAIGTGTLVATGTAVAVFIRSRNLTVIPNRRRRRRRRRVRRTSRR